MPNNIHNNIQFTMEHNQLYLPFLDIMVNKDPETKNIWWTYFIKKQILGYAFHLTLVTPNNAKTIYILHLSDEFTT